MPLFHSVYFSLSAMALTSICTRDGSPYLYPATLMWQRFYFLPEVAMNWVIDHMGDADFNDPLPDPGAGGATDAGASAAADPASLMMLTSIGFTERQATAALKATGGDAARGADWLYNHTDDLDKAVAEVGKYRCMYG